MRAGSHVSWQVLAGTQRDMAPRLTPPTNEPLLGWVLWRIHRFTLCSSRGRSIAWHEGTEKQRRWSHPRQATPQDGGGGVPELLMTSQSQGRSIHQ